MLLAWSRLTAKKKGSVVPSCTVDAQISPHPSSSLLSQASREYIANPPEPKGEDGWTKKKTKRDEEDERIMAVIDANIAKNETTQEAER